MIKYFAGWIYPYRFGYITMECPNRPVLFRRYLRHINAHNSNKLIKLSIFTTINKTMPKNINCVLLPTAGCTGVKEAYDLAAASDDVALLKIELVTKVDTMCKLINVVCYFMRVTIMQNTFQ